MRQGSSGLTLRDFQPQHMPMFELTPKKVNSWAINLAMANLGESAKSTYRLLVDVNLALLDPDKRLAILYAIEPVAHELTLSLEKQFIKNHIALTEKQKNIAALVQAIQTELSIGFHSVIESLDNSEIKRSQKGLLALALTSAINYHGFVILRCYQLYTSIPNRIWRELYCLYQIAVTHELATQTNQTEKKKQESSVHHSFIRILMLSIANPYQLRQLDIQLLWEILPELCEHATLISHAYNKNHFVISLDTSNAPKHKSLHQPSESNKNNLKLTVFTVVEHLKQMLVSITESGQQSVRKSMLLRHMIQTWSHVAQRSFARTACDESLDITIGLGATHYLLMQSPKEKNADSNASRNTLDTMEGSLKNATLDTVTKQTHTSSHQNKNYLSSSSAPDEDVWAKLYRPELAIKKALSEAESNNRTRDAIVKESYKLQQVALINMSPGGYCIQLASENLPKHAQTGEIIGVLESDQNQREHWSIGIVRWVRRQSKDNTVQMGVQLLAPAAIPINLQLRNSKNSKSDYQRGLILPALTGVGQPTTLLTNPLSFNTNSKVRIIDHGQEYDARLSKEIASSNSFKQFQFERISDGKNQKSKSVAPRDPSFDSNNLDGIWDLI